jgi:hypothetical protein
LFLFFCSASAHFRSMDFRCRSLGTIDPLRVEVVRARLIPECGQDICLCSAPCSKTVRPGLLGII